MLQNAYLVAKIGVDTAENGPRKECCVVAAERFSGTRSWRTSLGADLAAPGAEDDVREQLLLEKRLDSFLKI